MFNGLQWWHILLIVAAFILIFGAKKLPDAARGLGRSMRILKSEVSAMHDDDVARKGEPASTDGTAGAPAGAAAATVTPAIAPAAPAVAPIAAVSNPVVATAPVADPAPAPAASQPVLAGPIVSGTPATVQATTIDGKPAVIINGVPTLIDQAG